MRPLLLAQFDTVLPAASCPDPLLIPASQVVAALSETTTPCAEVNGEPFSAFVQRIRTGIMEFEK
jgi:hypothetical protein